MPRVYIIILNYRNWKDVAECLETLYRSNYDNFCVIVIDNHSQDNSLEYLVNWAENSTEFNSSLSSFSRKSIEKPICYQQYHSGSFPGNTKAMDLARLVLIQHNENKGFAGGINPVLTALIMEDAYIWLLNPDMVVEESTLAGLADFASSNKPESIIGSVIKFYSNPADVYLYAGGIINFNSGTVTMVQNKNQLSEMDYVSGGSLFTHASSFKKLGVLPEDYFLYWEEADWCYRAKMNGFSLQLCETAVCYDKLSKSIGKGFLAEYYYTRNGLMFLSKYNGHKLHRAIFLTLVRFFKKIAAGEPARAKGIYKGVLSFLKRTAA